MANGVERYNRIVGVYSGLFMVGSIAWKYGTEAIQSMMEANPDLGLPSAQLGLTNSTSLPDETARGLNASISTSAQDTTERLINATRFVANQTFNTNLAETVRSVAAIGSTALSISPEFHQATQGVCSAVADHCIPTAAGQLAAADCIASYAASAAHGALEVVATHSSSSSLLPYIAIGAVGAGAIWLGNVAMKKISQARISQVQNSNRRKEILNKFKQLALRARTQKPAATAEAAANLPVGKKAANPPAGKTAVRKPNPNKRRGRNDN